MGIRCVDLQASPARQRCEWCLEGRGGGAGRQATHRPHGAPQGRGGRPLAGSHACLVARLQATQQLLPLLRTDPSAARERTGHSGRGRRRSVQSGACASLPGAAISSSMPRATTGVRRPRQAVGPGARQVRCSCAVAQRRAAGCLDASATAAACLCARQVPTCQPWGQTLGFREGAVGLCQPGLVPALAPAVGCPPPPPPSVAGSAGGASLPEAHKLWDTSRGTHATLSRQSAHAQQPAQQI